MAAKKVNSISDCGIVIPSYEGDFAKIVFDNTVAVNLTGIRDNDPVLFGKWERAMRTIERVYWEYGGHRFSKIIIWRED